LNRVRRVHLAAQGLELGQLDLAGAAFGAGRRQARAVGVEGRRNEGLDAFLRQRRGQDVGGGVHVGLRVAADQFLVLREGDIALDDARTHARRGFIRLLGVFRDPQ